MLELKDVVVDEEFAALCPKLSDEEHAQLLANIARDGFRDAVVVWQNHSTILDGHNRFHIWQDAFDSDEEEKPEVVEVKLEDRDAAKAWIAMNQLGRRNLNSFQRIELALLLEPELKRRAKVNQKQSKGKGVKGSPTLGNLIDTEKEIAEAARISHGTLHKAKTILEKADPDTLEKLRRGDESINSAYMKLNPHVSQSTGDNELYTPEEIIQAAREVLGKIDLDPASSKEANKVVKAGRFSRAKTAG